MQALFGGYDTLEYLGILRGYTLDLSIPICD